jgi:hypothetical protein
VLDEIHATKNRYDDGRARVVDRCTKLFCRYRELIKRIRFVLDQIIQERLVNNG